MRVKKEQVKRSRYFEPGSSSPNKRVRVGDKQFNVESFEPVIGHNKRPHTLLLGTMPSITSHKVSQYYGHPSNAFWWIVGDAFKFRRGGMNIQHIIPMFLEITAGTITLTTLFVVIMKMMMNEEFEA